MTDCKTLHTGEKKLLRFYVILIHVILFSNDNLEICCFMLSSNLGYVLFSFLLSNDVVFVNYQKNKCIFEKLYLKITKQTREKNWVFYGSFFNLQLQLQNIANLMFFDLKIYKIFPKHAQA
jgi:hypothetical protein